MNPELLHAWHLRFEADFHACLAHELREQKDYTRADQADLRHNQLMTQALHLAPESTGPLPAQFVIRLETSDNG